MVAIISGDACEAVPGQNRNAERTQRQPGKAVEEFRAQLRRALDDLIVNEDIRDWMIEMPADLVKVDRGAQLQAARGGI